MSRMSVQPLFSSGRDPLKGIKWAEREVTLQGAARQVVTVTAPEAWSMTAVTVFASHYLRVVKGVRETHFGQAIARLADTISEWALADGYVDAEAGNHLRHELAYMLVYQMWSPNSPVWYNVGTVERPQISACYIQHLSDAMDGDDGIIALQSAETRLFRRGSGTGTNHSNLRPEGYPISVGGTASGPVSFMRGFDATAGAIKSGGSTRRAAKMVILNDDHPDIEKYVDAKPHVERMAWDLVDAGHSNDYNGPTYTNLALQNANHSVGTSDAFMQAVADDALWTLQFGGVPARTIRARELWARIVSAAHICGDPGLQFRDTINAWHTSPSGGPIVGSNPCAEFVYIDDSACNLAAHNLRQYQRKAQHPYAVRTHDENPVLVNTLDTDALRHAVGVSILVQDVLVSRASYPTAAIEINSLKYRPLGMGYANLGALLMSLGLGYDTDAGRALAGAITSFVCAEAYHVSQQLTQVKGVSFAQNADDGHAMRRVLGQHAKAAHKLVEQAQRVVADTSDTTRTGYTGQVAAYAAGLAIEAHGVWVRVANAKDLPRNGQATLLAPTGTSGLAMDCDTTGIEPDYALVKHKRLAGGGFLKIVNRTVKDALTVLGYTSAQISAIIAYVEAKEKIEGAPGLDPQHLPVFDCAGRCAEMTDEPGTRYLIPHAHIRMMAAAQPFLSGAISKTVNTPYETTLEEISALYSDAHALGLKCIAIYRDGSKANQPLCGARPPRFNHAHPHVVKTRDAIADALGLPAGQSLDELRAAITKLRSDKATGDLRAMCSVRRKLPAERQSVCKSFSVGAHDGYVHAGLYPDGTLGEIFVRMSKMGSTVSGLLDAWATMFSLALQYGAPLEVLCEKGTGSVFQPSGFTGDALRSASSPVDYVSRWLMSHSEFLPPEEPSMAPEGIHETHAEATQPGAAHKAGRSSLTEGPTCSVKGCGGTTRRSGACYVCESCGVTSGCG